MQTKTAGMQNHALTLTASATSAANTTQLSTLPTSMGRRIGRADRQLLRQRVEPEGVLAADERPGIGVVHGAVDVQALIEQVVEHDVRALLITGRARPPGLRQAGAARVAPVEQALALERHEDAADLLLPLAEHTGKARDRAGFGIFIEEAE